MKKLTQKGFTLVELMIVIVIVGILAAVAIPKFSAASDKARASEVGTVLTSIYTNEEAFKGENGKYKSVTFTTTTDWDSISMTKPTSRWFVYNVVGAAVDSFVAEGKVTVPFGPVKINEGAAINHNNAKSFMGTSTNLAKFLPNWQ